MKWVQTAWQLARDILLTGTGLWLIVSQVGAREPSDTLIVAGLALVMPAAASHGTSVAARARAVLSGPSAPEPGQEPSSPSSSPPSSSPSSPPGGTHEAR